MYVRENTEYTDQLHWYPHHKQQQSGSTYDNRWTYHQPSREYSAFLWLANECGLNTTLQNRQDFLPSKVWGGRRRKKWREVRQTLSLRPALEPPNLVLTSIVHPSGSHSGGGSSVAMDPSRNLSPLSSFKDLNSSVFAKGWAKGASFVTPPDTRPAGRSKD